MFYTAFLMGLAGSVHCVAMCGPLTLMLPNKTTNFKYIFGRIIYNFGRIITYSFLGAISGLIGEKILFFVSQKYLSIGIGIIILLFLVIPSSKKLINTQSIYQSTSFFKSTFAKLFKKQAYLSQFSFGLINGLLPCGLIYAALAGSFIMTNWYDAALYMALFGLGTVPLMLPTSLGFAKIKQMLGSHYQKIVTTTYLLLAVWMIFRGVNYNKTTLYTAPNQKPDVECVTPAH